MKRVETFAQAHCSELYRVSPREKRSRLISLHVSFISSYPAVAKPESQHPSLPRNITPSYLCRTSEALISAYLNHFLSHYLFSLKSTTLLLALSKLPRIPLLELLELPRLFLLASSGSVGCSPLAFANRFNMSVKLITPLNLPDICCPGIAEAETDGVALRGWKGGLACGKEVEMCWGCATGG